MIALFAALTVRGQTRSNDFDLPIYGKKGFWVEPGNTIAPIKDGVHSVLIPLTDKTGYFDTKNGRVEVTFGGAGVTYTPGIGLTLNDNAFSIRQWPAGSLGSIGVDGLFWAIQPTYVTAEALDLSNGHLLGILGNTTVRTRFGDLKAYLAQSFGVGSGGGGTQKGWRRIAPVKSHLEPAEPYDYFWYQAKLHLMIEKSATQNMWVVLNNLDTTFNYNLLPPAPVPTPTLSVTGVAVGTLSLSWPYTAPVTAFRLYVSKADTLHYQAVTPDLGAGLRTYNYTNAQASTRYYFKLQALTPSGPSPLSNTVSGLTPAADFSTWPNIQNVATTQTGPNSYRIDFDIMENGGGVRFDMTKASVTTTPDPVKDELYEYAGGMELQAAGHYQMNVNNVTGTQARWLRFKRTSTYNDGKLPSNWGTHGPFSLSGSSVVANAPAINSASNVTNNSLTLNLNLNNSDVYRVILYTSANNQITYTSQDIPVASTYNVTGLAPGVNYFFRLQVTKRDGSSEVYSPNSNDFSVATTGTNTSICNYSESASGGYVVTTKTFTASQSGNVYYQIDCGQIPDKITVKKNGTVVATPFARSWRTRGQVAVSAGDVIEFTVDPKITGDQGTGWTLYANCSTPYNVDSPQAGYDYGNKDYPFINEIDYTNEGLIQINRPEFKMNLIVKAVPSRATGAAIVSYKAVNTDYSFRDDMGWYPTSTLVQDQNGSRIVSQRTYTVYVKDANGKVYGVAGITRGGTFTEDIPAAQPVTLVLSGTSATSTTITVTNHGSGTKNYSWAVYEGEFNNGGVWKRCAENNIPSTGSFTVDISSCGLTPGVTYRMYVTETNNADAKRGYVEFTVPSSPVDPTPSSDTFRTSSYISN